MFDSYYDQYRGVVSAVRVLNGSMSNGRALRFMQAGDLHEIEEIGLKTPDHAPVAEITTGEVGYLIAGIKNVAEARSGETDHRRGPARRPSRSRATWNPSRWCSAACSRSTATSSKTCAKRSRSSGSTTRRSPTSPRHRARSGFGFRCGFLGLLHMEIVRERLEREFNLSLIATAPSVAYRAHVRGDELIEVDNPAAMPPGGEIEFIEEPMLKITILSPSTYTGTLMELCQSPARRDGRAWSTCRPNASSCTTGSRSPRS